MFRLTIDTDNAAFGPTTSHEAAELGRCLRLVVALMEEGRRAGTVHDYNGNTVGQWTMDAAPDETLALLKMLAEALHVAEEGATKVTLQDMPGIARAARKFGPALRKAIAKAEGREP